MKQIKGRKLYIELTLFWNKVIFPGNVLLKMTSSNRKNNGNVNQLPYTWNIIMEHDHNGKVNDNH